MNTHGIMVNMKIRICLILMMLTAVCNAGEFKILGRDYGLSDVVEKPISVGLSSWSDKELGTVPALYASLSMMSYSDNIRFETGIVGTMGSRTVDVAILTGLSTPVGDNMVAGVWLAPFWNLYKPKYSDDAWGIMVGYRF